MNIEDETIDYKANSPIGIRIYQVRHYKPHQHINSLELIYCVKGQVCLVAGHQRVQLGPGDIFSIDCQDIHCLLAENENLLISLYIDLTSVNISWDHLKYVFFACESMHHQPYQEEPMKEVKDILLSLAYIEVSDIKMDLKDYTNIANKLVNVLLSYFDWFNSINIFAGPNEQTRERFHRIAAYCQKNYMNKITISQLAKAEFINENYFSQFLRKSSFRGFSNMLNFIRCFESEGLLLKTALPISEIARQCGFSDAKYYYRHFKIWWNKTPQQHRMWYKQYFECPASYEELAPKEYFDFIESYIAKYHVNYSLEVVNHNNSLNLSSL